MQEKTGRSAMPSPGCRHFEAIGGQSSLAGIAIFLGNPVGDALRHLAEPMG